MTMFSRNDKMPEPATAGKPATPDAAVASSPPAHPAAPEPRAAQASSASASSSSSSPSSSSRGTPSVSVISKELKITGQLESTEDIHIEGEVDGDVRGRAVKIGHNARVKGTVYGEEVEVSGTVTGKIEARKVVLTGTGHMAGDVLHQEIRIDSGAYMDGHCRPEYGKPDGKAHAIQKSAGSPREGFSPAKGGEVRNIA